MSKCLGRDISVRQHSKSEHWAPCHIQTPSRYDWKRLKATLSPNQTNKSVKSNNIFLIFPQKQLCTNQKPPQVGAADEDPQNYIGMFSWCSVKVITFFLFYHKKIHCIYASEAASGRCCWWRPTTCFHREILLLSRAMKKMIMIIISFCFRLKLKIWDIFSVILRENSYYTIEARVLWWYWGKNVRWQKMAGCFSFSIL